MATTSARRTTITYTGDTTAVETLDAAANAVSPGSVHLITLAAGFNSITKPAGGSTVVSVTIVPPAANAVAITLKGITGDTGIRIHNTDPTTIALDSSVTAVGITAAIEIVGVRLYWA